MGTEGGSFKKFKKHVGLSRFLFCYFILFYPFCFTPFTLLSVFQMHRGVYRPGLSYCAMYSNFSPPPYFGLGSSCDFVGKSPQLRKLS